MSPKYASGRPAASPTVTADRTIVSASNVQYVQPVRRLNENTRPETLPMNTRPPTTDGCAAAWTSPGKPNAHFTRSPETCDAFRPALRAVWYRLLVGPAPHPFQAVCDARTDSSALASPQRRAVKGGAVA